MLTGTAKSGPSFDWARRMYCTTSRLLRQGSSLRWRAWLHVFRRHLTVLSLVVATGLWGCDSDPASIAKQAQTIIRSKDAPRIAAILQADLDRHQKGLSQAAQRLAPGFVRARPESIEAEMRTALRLVRSSRRGVPELVISPLSFLAAVGADGQVIAREIEPDPMRGLDVGQRFTMVQSALAGKFAQGIDSFESDRNSGAASWLMAAPAQVEGRTVGALLLGIPLWRLAQRLSKQLQAEAQAGTVIWAYVYRGDQLVHHGTPPDVDRIVPTAAVRRAGLARQPEGFTSGVHKYGYAYAWGVFPMPVLGPGVGVVVMRME